MECIEALREYCLTHPPACEILPIGTVFGRDAGHERGDDHVTRASDAIERESGKRRGGKSRERSAGRERAGRESGRAEHELDRGPGDADGSGREHEKAAGPTPKTPDVDRRRTIRGGGIRQAMYAAQSFIRIRRRSNRSVRR